MPYAERKGVRLYFEEQGSGEPLLLIMGLGGDIRLWSNQLPALAPHYRVIAFDNRGSGRSDVPPGPYSIAEMADDALAVLDHLGVERAHVLGWSMGGMIAQELAVAYPERVDRLALLSTVARSYPWLSTWFGWAAQARERGMDTTGMALWLMPWFYTTAFMSQGEKVQAALDAAAADPDVITAEGYAAQAAACRAYVKTASLDRLAAITAMTLVLVGADDVLTPPVYAWEIGERIANARVAVLSGGGHGIPLERPDAVNNAVLDFLAFRPAGP